ncbi:hypothetical protein [Massilia sp. TWP1-3-3]|uniref:hypothetical protein n=1 Tax=Massilia sp. TWP1-3-3 TaxID=2804573 RepID=UPI003CF64905
MNKPRPFLTALCFVLFAATFVSSNVRSAAVHCPSYCAEAAPMQRLVDDVRRLLQRAGQPGRAD